MWSGNGTPLDARHILVIKDEELIAAQFLKGRS